MNDEVNVPSSNDTVQNTEQTPVAETPVVATTPGKIARRKPVKMVDSDGNTVKKTYRPRKSTTLCKRVLLFSGKPIGRGKPKTEGKDQRYAVYIPKDSVYDSKIHGPGVLFSENLHVKPIDRIDNAILSAMHGNNVTVDLTNTVPQPDVITV